MVELDFSAKTVLIVGGSSGIGNGMAQSSFDPTQPLPPSECDALVPAR